MSTNVAGFNLKTTPGQLYYCDVINGKRYVSVSRQSADQREFKRTWPGLAGTLDFYAHEIRHSDSGAPGHVTGCEARPLPSHPPGCDSAYDLDNLGSYGVQYWLQSRWATGYLNIGIGCSPELTAMAYAKQHERDANQSRNRFVTNIPQMVVATAPYGGPCLAGGSRRRPCA